MSILETLAKKLLGGENTGNEDGAPLGPIQDVQEQTPEEVQLYGYIKSKLEDIRSNPNRLALENNYLTNVAYLMGFSGVRFDASTRQFRNVDVKTRVNSPRYRINKILPVVQNRLARICQSPPKYDVRPNSNDSQDKDAARLGLKVLNDVFDKQYFTEKRQELHMSAMQGGHAYIQCLWDSTIGKPLIDPLTGNQSGYEGDIRIEVHNCLEIFPDPLAKRLEDAQFIIKAKVRKLDYFRTKYPERGQAVKEEDAWLISSIYDLKANGLSGNSGGSQESQMKNAAIEIVYYERRCEKYPNGRMVVGASGVILEDKELPIGEYDIFKADDIIIGGRYNPEAIITHLRPIQDQYNMTRGRCGDWVRLNLSGKYLAAKGAGLSQEAINNATSEVVEFNPVPNAPPPQAMTIPVIPSYVYEEISTLDNEFDRTSGIGETSQGKLESASMPGNLGQLLQEQDQTRLSIQTTRNEITYSKLGSAVLKYASKYYIVERLLKSAGDGLEYAVKEFKGEDLKGNTDAFCIPGSTVPNSKVLKRQDIINTYQMGLLGNPQDPKLQAKVLKMLEFGDVAEMWKTQALTEANIKKAIEQIEQGEIPTYHELDNHPMYIQELNDYRLGDKYLALDQAKKAVFDVFLETHIQGQVRLTNPMVPDKQQMAETMVQTMEGMHQSGEADQIIDQPPEQIAPDMQEAPQAEVVNG